VNLAVQEQDTRSASAGALQQQTSKVLGNLFRNLDTGHRLNILEVGRVQPETVDFFSRFRCRIHVLDLYTELSNGAFEDDSGAKTLQRTFQEKFNFEPGLTLDICLLWDFPHYLDETRLRAFSRALWPWLSRSTRAHGFGVHSAATTLQNQEYGIVDLQTISARPRQILGVPRSPHPQSFMNEWLSCFSAGRGVLLADGKVETMMLSKV